MGGREGTVARGSLRGNQRGGRAVRTRASGLLFFPPAGGHGEIYGVGHGGFVNLTLPTHGRHGTGRHGIGSLRTEMGHRGDRQAGVSVNVLKMVGGASRSPVWPQIVADVTCLPVALPAISQAASWGAAILRGGRGDLRRC